MGMELIEAICDEVVKLEIEANYRTLSDWERGKLTGLHSALNLVNVTYPNFYWNKPMALLRRKEAYSERLCVRNG